MGDTRAAADRIRRDHDRIDVLINNAGARFLRHELTEEGIERTLATNYMGPFVLTLSLMASLRRSGRARIINVASGAHYGGHVPIENIRSSAAYDGKRQYAESKLAVVLFTVALAERLKDERIAVNALDPGAAASSFSRNNGTWSWLKHRLSYLLRGQLRTPAMAAETIVYLAEAEEVAGLTGRYFRDKRETTPSEISRSSGARDALWASSVALAGIDL
jgi:retinol dehydrogenase 14